MQESLPITRFAIFFAMFLRAEKLRHLELAAVTLPEPDDIHMLVDLFNYLSHLKRLSFDLAAEVDDPDDPDRPSVYELLMAILTHRTSSGMSYCPELTDLELHRAAAASKSETILLIELVCSRQGLHHGDDAPWPRPRVPGLRRLQVTSAPGVPSFQSSFEAEPLDFFMSVTEGMDHISLG